MCIDQDNRAAQPHTRAVLVTAERLIHSLYGDWLAAVGSEHCFEIAEAVLAPDFVYTGPGLVLLGREAFLNALRGLEDVTGVEGLRLTIRYLGGQAVATGACRLHGEEQAPSRPYTFSALWRGVGSDWSCVAQRGDPALLSEHPIGR